MFFTREDILKIQNALLKLSVKDSELPNAEPVTYDDTLSIIQDGKNKQIKIEDFFNQISLWKREDFINITDKYDEHYISLIEAINLVPVLQRKDGLVITFQDIEGNWEIYQFRGNIIEFFNIEKWFNLYDYRNNIIQSIVPDEEDLTASIPDENKNSLVSLKNRVYDPISFSGKGYKILRKNITQVSLAVTKIIVSAVPTSDGYISFIINGVESHVDVATSSDTTTDKVADKIVAKLTETMTEYEVSKDASTITLTRKFDGEISTLSFFSAVNTGVSCTITDSTKKELRNILTQDMINQANTIYVIRYDFTFGEDITVPDNCILEFDGGSISGGSIIFINTLILGNPKIEVTKYSGSIKNDIIEAKWFSNSNKELKWLFDISENHTINLEFNKTYNIDYLFKFYSNSIINGNNATIILDNTDEKVENFNISFTNKQFSTYESNLYDSNIKVINLNFIIGSHIGHCNILSFSHVKDLYFYNITIKSLSLENLNNNRYCFDLYGDCENVYVHNSSFINLSKSSIGLCIQVRSISGDIKNVFIDKCIVKHSCLDEAIAIFANIHNLDNVRLSNIDVEYTKNEINDNGTLISVFSYDGKGIVSNVYLDNFNVKSNGLGHRIFGITYYPELVKNVNISNSSIIVTNVQNNKNNIVIDGNFIVSNSSFNIDNSKFIFNNASVYNCIINIKKGVVIQGGSIQDSLIKLEENTFLYSYFGTNNIFNCTINSYTNSIAVSAGLTHIFNFSNNVLNGKLENNSTINFTGSSNTNIIKSNVFNKVNVIFNNDVIHTLYGNIINNCTISNKNEKYTEDKSILPYWHKKIGTTLERPEAEDSYVFLDSDFEKPVFKTPYGYIDSSGGKNTAYFKEAKIFNNWESGCFDLQNSTVSDETIQGQYFNSMKIEVKKGDTFHIKTTGNIYAARPYATTDKNLKVISRASTDTVDTNIEITENGFLFINTFSKENALIEGNIQVLPTFEKIVDKIENIKVIQSGLYISKPVSPSIGFEYFCTDKQTSEGATNGIMIYHKGNDVWVDALGRVIS